MLITDGFAKWDERTYKITAEALGAYNTLLCDERYYPAAPAKVADAELIALAPEMAEAILEMDDYLVGEIPPAYLVDIADKLRAIGEPETSF